MKEYLGALVATALFGGVVRMLSPEGDLQKYLRLTVALCLVAAMAQPILTVLTEGQGLALEEWLLPEKYETQDYDEIYNQALQNGTKAQVEEIVKTKIYQELSLSEETAAVRVSFLSENGTLQLDEVVLTLRGEGVLTDPREIVSFVNETWECSCAVIYE